MKKTPLNKIHREEGAKLINFGGWEMPVQYTGIIEEHNVVREKCGLFDVSHMGEIRITGDRALKMVNNLITNNAAELETGQILYSPLCYPDGGIVDDLLVYRMGEDEFLLVVNAANTEKDWEWIQDNTLPGAVPENVSDQYAQLALQGPESKKVLQEITGLNLDELKYYWFVEGEVAGSEVLLSRTGYTGELGYELYVDPEEAAPLWKNIMEAGDEYDIRPIGLGARDTLRLEKKFCLYGNDITKETHPLEAGLGWTVDFSKDDFIGKQELSRIKNEGYDRELIGFKVVDRGIPRHGYEIKIEDEKVGEVTSGSFSPTLEENIGLGYVLKEYAAPGQEINIVIRRREVKAEVVKAPFV